jgi:CheY-like chemotaxis protein
VGNVGQASRLSCSPKAIPFSELVLEMARLTLALLDLAVRQSFDPMVSDIGLPDESDFELIRRLSLDRPIKRIAVSGFGMEGDREKSRDAGFAEHLLKPVKTHDLEAAIQNAAATP